MPSNIGKTTKRGTTKRVAGRSRRPERPRVDTVAPKEDAERRGQRRSLRKRGAVYDAVLGLHKPAAVVGEADISGGVGHGGNAALAVISGGGVVIGIDDGLRCHT